MTSPITLVTGSGGPAGRAVSQYFQQNGIDVLCADMRPLSGPDNFRLLPPAHDEHFVGVLDYLVDEAAIRLLVPTVTEELELSMLLGVPVLLRTEDYQDTQAVPARHQRDGAIGQDSFQTIVLFYFKVHLFLQVPAQDGFLVLKHPSMMRFLAVQH
jgi:hypothetical protein